MSNIFTQGYALVIGIGSDLPVTIDDATAVASLLQDQSRCAYPMEQVRLLTDKQSNRESILNSLDWLSSVTNSESTVIIYFSGHGIETPDYYLLPFGYDLSDLSNTAICEMEFTSKIRSIKTRKLVVFLDCCHAGGQAEAKGVIKSPMPMSFITELKNDHGRVILASSRKDEVSFVDQPYSAFTIALLEGFAGYGAFEQDGYARILDIAMWVGRRVPELTKDKQHPIIKVSQLENNFALGWCVTGTNIPKLLNPTHTTPSLKPIFDNAQKQSLKRRLKNYQENLFLIEERMSEYIYYTDIPLQLIKEKGRMEDNIAKTKKELDNYL